MEQSQGTGAAGGAAQGAAIGTSILPGWGTAIGAVVGGIAGFLGGGGEKAAKKAAKLQAAEIRRAAEENKRNQIRQANQVVSTAKARSYASNIMDTGSTRQYRSSLESEYRRAIDYSYQNAQMQAEQVRKGGQAAADSIKRAGWGQVVSGITAAGSAYAGGGFGGGSQGSAGLGYVQAGSGGKYTTSAPAPSLLVKK